MSRTFTDEELAKHDSEVRASVLSGLTVERIAETIRKSDWDALGDWNDEPERIKEGYRKNARAVLALIEQEAAAPPA